MNLEKTHESVLINEVVDVLGLGKIALLKNQARYKNKRKKLFIDATLGSGGHSIEIIKAGGKVLGIEADRQMLAIASVRLKKACPILETQECFTLVHGNYRFIDQIAQEKNFTDVTGIIFDLGISNVHFSSLNRGFSFSEPNAPLDMRIDQESQSVTAALLLNTLRKDQIRNLFREITGEIQALKLSNAVVLQRKIKPFKTVGDLLIIVKNIHFKPNLNPATLPFLALRVAVNSELENLKEALPKALSLLKTKGRLVVISFHSVEDREVKKFFKTMRNSGKAKVLTNKPIQPSDVEINKNPRARSAKLRILKKI